MLMVPSPHGTQMTDPQVTVTREAGKECRGEGGFHQPLGGSEPSTGSCTHWHFTNWLNTRGNPATHNRDWKTRWNLTSWKNNRVNTATHNGNWDVTSWNSTSRTSNIRT